MPISSLVLNLKDGEVPAELQQNSYFELGELYDQRLPVVLDTPSEEKNKEAWTWLNSLIAVDHIDVVFVSFEKDYS